MAILLNLNFLSETDKVSDICLSWKTAYMSNNVAAILNSDMAAI